MTFRRLLTCALSFALLAAAALVEAPANASTYYADGYCSPEGYTYRGGYWWRGQRAYSRQRVTRAAYCSGGCHYPARAYWRYSEVPVAHDYPAAASPALPAANDPAKYSKLLEVYQQRQTALLRERSKAFDHYYWSEAVKALGLDPLPIADAGYSPYRFGSGLRLSGASYQLSDAGVNGTTVYGYNAVQSSYGDNNIPLMAQAFARTVERAQQLGGQAAAAQGDHLTAEADKQARVAEIQARAQAEQARIAAAAQLIQAATVPETRRESREFRVRFGPQGMETVEPIPAAGQRTAALNADALLRQSCVACHGAKDPKGGLNLSVGWAALTPAQQAACRERVVSTNPDEVMPRTNDNKPAPLPVQQQRAFFE